MLIKFTHQMSFEQLVSELHASLCSSVRRSW